MRFKLLLIALCLVGSAAILNRTAAQSYQPPLCPNQNAAYYRPNLFPRHTNADNRLELADWSTGETVMTLEDTLPYTYSFSWSPDCRYLVGRSIGYENCNPGLLIWDAASGERKLTLRGFCDTLTDGKPVGFWRADSTAVLLTEWYDGWNSSGSWDTRLIWYPESNTRVDLQITGVNPNLFQVDWDDARGWVWGSGDCGVTAFDVHTGVQTISFKNLPVGKERNWCWGTSSRFAFSPDHSKVIVYGQLTPDNRTYPAMTVYDIASGVGTQVNVELNGEGAVALSPDNRYLVMGYTALRVWDLASLPPQIEDRLPVYRYGVGENRIIGAVTFVDATTVEVKTNYRETTRWNILTGAQVEPEAG